MSCMVALRIFIVLGIIMMGCLPSLSTEQAQPATDAEIRLLLSRLNLELPDLAAVKAATDPEQAATKLLSYYRARTGVKHFVDPTTREAWRGKYAAAEQLRKADDGVQSIFYSLPAYPSYDFGEKIDWFTNRTPTQDSEWIRQLHRQYWWNDLARAYWHTGEERYADAWVRQMRDWIRQCPCNGKAPAWVPIEAGIRGFQWTGHFQHFLNSPSFTPRDLVLFLNSCWEHANYLTDMRTFSTTNWGLMEAEGTAFIAITFPEFSYAQAWRQKAVQYLADEIVTQVRPDGHHTEQCFNYHGYSIDWFANTAKLAKLNGQDTAFPASFWQRLERMCDVFVQLGLPDGSSAQFGDTHSPLYWRRLLGGWADYFKREDFRFVARDGAAGTPPSATAFALPDSGFYSMRSGWQRDATCLVLKCGPDGGWHCQPDNTTFELYAGGRRLMPDSGTYNYGGDAEAQAMRAWFRQTKVHQTLTLNDQDTLYQPKLVLWQPGETLDKLVIENAGYPTLTHRRAVLFVQKRFFIIVDDALGEATSDVDLHFQLLPCKPVVVPAAYTVHTAFGEGANVLIQGMPQTEMTLDMEEGWVSYEYGKRESRPALRFRQHKTTPAAVRFVTLVIPYTGAIPPETEMRLLDGNTDNSRIKLQVRVGEINMTVEL